MRKITLVLILVSLAILVSGCGRKYYDNDIKKADTQITIVADNR